MATRLRVQRPKAVRLVLVSLAVILFGVTLAWSITPAVAHTVGGSATPGDEEFDGHSWGERGCTLPGAAIDSVPGLFDFRHACTHHNGCYEGFDRTGATAVIDRARCDELFRTDLAASCEYLHGTVQNWRARECESTANAYYEVARSFGRSYYTGAGNPS